MNIKENQNIFEEKPVDRVVTFLYDQMLTKEQ